METPISPADRLTRYLGNFTSPQMGRFRAPLTPGSPITTTRARIPRWTTAHPQPSLLTSTQPALALRSPMAPRSARLLYPRKGVSTGETLIATG